MWQFNPWAILLLLMTIPLGFVLYKVWHQRHLITIRYFLYFMSFALLFALFYALELFSATLEGMLFSIRLQYIGHLCAPTFLCFALAHTGYERFLKPRYLFWLFLPVPVAWLFQWTSASHQLFYTYTGIQMVDGLAYFDREYGWLMSVWIIYIYVTLIGGSLILLVHTWRSHSFFKRQSQLVVLGAVMGMIGGLMTLLRLVPHIDFTPIGIVLSTLPLSFSLWRYQLLNIIPVAHSRAIQTMRDAVIVCNEHYQVVDANPMARALQKHPLPDAAIVGVSLEQFLPEVVDYLKDNPQIIAGEETFNFHRSQDSQTLTYEVLASSLNSANHDFEGLVLVVRDVSKRIALQESQLALRLEREKTQLIEVFLRDTSHDLRTPLSVIDSSLYLVERTLLNCSKEMQSLAKPDCADLLTERLEFMLKRLNNAQVSSKRLQELIEMMHEMTRLEHHSGMNFHACQPKALIQRLVQRFQPMATEHELGFEQVLAADLPSIMADDWELERALSAILNNAFSYTPKGGKVLIQVSKPHRHLLISITDTGIGMSEDVQKHIFERFYRADHSRNTSTGGAGLGLSIAKTIIEAHHGTISVTSTEGTGSCFTISLPLAMPSSKPALSPP